MIAFSLGVMVAIVALTAGLFFGLFDGYFKAVILLMLGLNAVANGRTLGKDKAMIILSDVLSWCASYKGKKFHALLCDPPYHLYSPVSKRPAGKWDGTRKDPFQRVKGGGFMGKDWDGGDIAFQPDTWAALAEHLHDGAFIMAFASSRGWHRQAVAMEDAGLIMHPSIFGWAYGSGFPKATRIDTQIDKAAGVEQISTGNVKRVGISARARTGEMVGGIAIEKAKHVKITAPATDLAKAWASHRYGLQALKPAVEPILVFQKPYKGKAVECITRTGAGALNIEQSRIGAETVSVHNAPVGSFAGGEPDRGSDVESYRNHQGRWPANLVLTHTPECKCIGEKKVKGIKGGCTKVGGMFGSGNPVTSKTKDYTAPDGTETIPEWECPEYCPVRRLGEQSGEIKSGNGKANTYEKSGGQWGKGIQIRNADYGDSGTAARFFFQADYELENADPIFYTAKASRSERDAGLEGMQPKRMRYEDRRGQSMDIFNTEGDGRNTDNKPVRNAHPTVKPIKLTQHLATLLLPPKEYAPRRILVPFAGVGSEMIGAMLAGWEEIVGIELNQEYVDIAEARVNYWQTRQLELL